LAGSLVPASQVRIPALSHCGGKPYVWRANVPEVLISNPLLVTVFGLAAIGTSAAADVRFGTAIWTCENQVAARLDMTRLPAVEPGERVIPVSEVGEPFSCDLPWGRLEIEVVGYNTPDSNQSCGLAEAWGLRVIANGKVLEDLPADDALSCFSDDFDPFIGWIEADAERVLVCQTTAEDLRSATQRCTSLWAPSF
jgi:hypothetical protein